MPMWKWCHFWLAKTCYCVQGSSFWPDMHCVQKNTTEEPEMLDQVASFRCLPFFVPWNSNRGLTGKMNELMLYVDSFFRCPPAICIFCVTDYDVLQLVQSFWVPAIGPYTGANLSTRVNGKFIQEEIVCGLLVSLFCTGFECPQCLYPEEMVVQKMAAGKRRCMGMNASLFYKREGF